MTWQCAVHTDGYRVRSRLLLSRGTIDGYEYVGPMVVHKMGEMEVPPDDAYLAQGHPEEIDAILRAIMTEAWARGIRPEGYENHTNELAAVRYHLEDMRALAKVPGAVNRERDR